MTQARSVSIAMYLLRILSRAKAREMSFLKGERMYPVI